MFNLAAKGHTLHAPPEDNGSDIESGPETDLNANDIDSVVSQMWRQFLVDIANRTPVARGAISRIQSSISSSWTPNGGEGAKLLAVQVLHQMEGNLFDRRRNLRSRYTTTAKKETRCVALDSTRLSRQDVAHSPEWEIRTTSTEFHRSCTTYPQTDAYLGAQ
jgi:hypothetical protein